MSRINVDKITGATGTASGAPITLSGDTATLGSGADIKGAINASGTAPIYACRAWAQIDGANNNLNADGNISGVTESSDLYTVNFETALDDTNYSVNVSFKRESGNPSSSGMCALEKSQTLSNSSFKLYFFDASPSTLNPDLIFISVFR